MTPGTSKPKTELVPTDTMPIFDLYDYLRTHGLRIIRVHIVESACRLIVTLDTEVTATQAI